MIIFPAIDLMEGRAVRLQKGLREQKTDYGDPCNIAAQFREQGAQWLHIVDLSAAFDGHSKQGNIIQEIVKVFAGKVQMGGGIRSLDDVKRAIEDYGVTRLILGTAAVENPALVARACECFPSQIACGIDAKNGVAALRGWVKDSGITAVNLANQMKELGIDTIIYTDIEKDGMMQGANIIQTKQMVDQTGLNIIGSGGVNSLESLKELKQIGCYGAITGKALYENAFGLKDALMI